MSGPIRPSLIDRLSDEPGLPGCSLEEFTASVVRDLNDLVNTPRADLSEIPESFSEVRASLLAYGLPRPGLLGKSEQDRAQVRAELKEAIYRFEPRLLHVNVLDARAPDGKERADSASLRAYAFRITATLRSDPLPSEVVLGATLSRYPQAIEVLPRVPGESSSGKKDQNAG